MQDTNTDFSRNFYLFVLKGEQMRVLHVISDENIGGAGILLTNLLSLFDPRVIESTVALPQNSQLQERLAELGVRTLPLEHIASRPSFSSICEICKYVKKNIKMPYFTEDFWKYLLTKVFVLEPDFEWLDNKARRFLSLSGVLRSKRQDKNI